MRCLMDGFGLLGAARWYPQRGLLFSDMTCGGVYRYQGDAHGAELIVAHRKGIGGLVAHRDGGLVVAGRNVAIKGFDGTTTVIAEPANDESFFNDLTADRHGRLIVGSVGIGPSPREGVRGGRCRPGRLYRLDVDGTRTVLAEDVLASNGLGTSPDGDVLYHVDSYRQTIWAFDDADNRRKFADTSDYGGVPAGIAVAADGIVYVPMAGSGVVLGWDADGKIVAELPVPQPLVTSICFGVGDLRSLFVLTGVNDEHEDERGGAVYVTTAPSVGQASPVCAVVPRGDPSG